MEPGAVQFLIVIIATTLFAMIIIIFGIVGYVQKKKVQFILEQERAKANYEEELLTSRMEIYEQNLKNISWELHDNIGQILSVASMQTKIMLQKSEFEKQDLEEISHLISESLGQTRKLSTTLNRETLEHIGLVKALSTELERLERLKILSANLVINGDIDLSKDKEVIIFRMLQEFISNVVKHAQADELSIVIDADDNSLKILASDNGKGYLESETVKNSGIINMHSRAKVIGAQIVLESKPGKGTRLFLSLPV